MKPQGLISLISVAALVAIPFPSVAQETSRSDSETGFKCDFSQKTPVTLVTGRANLEKPGPYPLIKWRGQYFNSSQEALSLCQEVSQQLQTFYEERTLTDLVFVSEQFGDRVAVYLEGEEETECDRDRLLFTLTTDQSPREVLNAMIGKDFKPPVIRGDFKTAKIKLTNFFEWLD